MIPGIWVRNASTGELEQILGGTRGILKEVIPLVIESVDTVQHTVTIPVVPGAGPMVAHDTSESAAGDNGGEFVTTLVDADAGVLRYQFSATDKRAVFTALAL